MTYCVIGDMATRVTARDLIACEFETWCWDTFVVVVILYFRGGKTY